MRWQSWKRRKEWRVDLCGEKDGGGRGGLTGKAQGFLLQIPGQGFGRNTAWWSVVVSSDSSQAQFEVMRSRGPCQPPSTSRSSIPGHPCLLRHANN